MMKDIETLTDGEIQLIKAAMSTTTNFDGSYFNYEINTAYMVNLNRSARSLIRKKLIMPNGKFTGLGMEVREFFDSFEKL